MAPEKALGFEPWLMPGVWTEFQAGELSISKYEAEVEHVLAVYAEVVKDDRHRAEWLLA